MNVRPAVDLDADEQRHHRLCAVELALQMMPRLESDDAGVVGERLSLASVAADMIYNYVVNGDMSLPEDVAVEVEPKGAQVLTLVPRE